MPDPGSMATGDLSNRLKIADKAIKLARKLLANLGPLFVENGLLYAGDSLINDNQSIVDEVQETTRFGCTIFLGNVRIATSVVNPDSQKRAVGTEANQEVTQLVFNEGGTFRGRTTTIGRDWVIVYEPLEDRDGSRVGMIAAYRELPRFTRESQTEHELLTHGTKKRS